MTDFKIKRIGTLGRKQVLALRRYSTPRKLSNLVHCELEKRTRTVNTSAMPYTASIDVTNLCNLRCPGCPTGLGLKGRRGAFLDPHHLRSFLDQIADYILIANLFNWGESLLHPDIAAIVSSVHERGIFTSISSNLCINDPHRLENLCDAGLDHLIVSADGATEYSYNIYRRGGDFNLVLRNIGHLAEYKRLKGKSNPIIEWQMLAFRHLESEITAASELARKAGADWFTVRGPVAPTQFQPGNRALAGSFYEGRTRCDLLWYNITLQSNGGIAPCCMVYNEEDDFGHLEAATIRELRNNGRYHAARMLFKERNGTAVDVALDHPCLRCPIVHRQKHLEGFFTAHQELFAHGGFQSVVATADDLARIATGFELSP